MAKFTFYKDVEVSSWVRDKYEVVADTQEEAEEIVRNATDIEDVGEFVSRNTDVMLDTMVETGYSEILNEYGEEIY